MPTTTRPKQRYTIQVEEDREDVIRGAIDQFKQETGMSKRRIATELLLFAIKQKKKITKIT